MSAKGDARPERQSSWPSSTGTARRTGRAHAARYAPLGFAGFVLWHFTCQAYRAHTDGAIPGVLGPGIELQPWFVGSVLLLVWLPFPRSPDASSAVG